MQRNIYLLPLLVLLLTLQAYAQGPCFEGAVSYAVGSQPRSVVAADLDGDGDRDLAVANYDPYGSGSISVLKNNGDGTFASAVSYAAGYTPRSVVATDLDGDGDQDLAVANYSNTVSVLMNNGDGTLAAAVNYAVIEYPASVFAADLDGDGDHDLAVTSNSSGRVSVLRNKGDGTFATAATFAVGSNPWSAFVADLDGDGDQDLAVANYDGLSVSVLINCTCNCLHQGDLA